jgi:hypothetical protein
MPPLLQPLSDEAWENAGPLQRLADAWAVEACRTARVDVDLTLAVLGGGAGTVSWGQGTPGGLRDHLGIGQRLADRL